MTKSDTITIAEMLELFGTSRMTIYERYMPFLEKIPTTDNKIYFYKSAAISLHKKIMAEVEAKKKKGVRGNFGRYKQVQ